MPPLPSRSEGGVERFTLTFWSIGCHKKGYITALNSCIASGHEEKLVLLPGNNHIAVEMKNLGLPSLKIPALFLAVNLSQPPVLHTTNRSRIPTPPTSPRSIDTKSTASSIGTSVGSPHVENSDPAIAGENSHALRKTDPKHVESSIIRDGSGTDDSSATICFGTNIAAPSET